MAAAKKPSKTTMKHGGEMPAAVGKRMSQLLANAAPHFRPGTQRSRRAGQGRAEQSVLLQEFNGARRAAEFD